MLGQIDKHVPTAAALNKTGQAVDRGIRVPEIEGDDDIIGFQRIVR